MRWIYYPFCHFKSYVIDIECFTPKKSISSLLEVYLFCKITVMFSIKFPFFAYPLWTYRAKFEASNRVCSYYQCYSFFLFPPLYLGQFIWNWLKFRFTRFELKSIKIRCDRHYIISISKYRWSFNKYKTDTSLFLISICG